MSVTFPEPFRFRTSDFEFPSDLGFRASDFPPPHAALAMTGAGAVSTISWL
jgi:hypothetical protein